jgi:hypothetical protein
MEILATGAEEICVQNVLFLRNAANDGDEAAEPSSRPSTTLNCSGYP